MDNQSANYNSPSLVDSHSNNHSLPFEILTEIFSHLTSDGPLQLRHVLFVARSWYNAAVYSPNLWTAILIDREFHLRCRDGWLAHGEAFIRCCFTRSRDLPMTISVKYQDERAQDEPLTGAFLSTVIGRLLGSVDHCHTKRCKALTWTFFDPDFDVYAFRTIFPSQLDMLEYLSLQDFVSSGIELAIDETSSALQFPHCPNLKEVSLTDHSETEISRFFRDEDLERVEKLTFGNTSIWMSYDTLCISRYRNIHTLILRGNGVHMSDGQGYKDWVAGGRISAYLPRLKTLLAIGYIPRYILESIKAPDLISLRLEMDEEAHHTLGTIPTTLLATLHSIDISFRPLPTPSWVLLLHSIISKAPRLSHVFVPEWMKDDLELEDWYRQLDVFCHYL